ncbi:hypothetical protein ACQEXP_03385 [Vibrio sp. TRT 1302]
MFNNAVIVGTPTSTGGKVLTGTLDSVKGIARYVKITAPVEALVGSSINVLQFVLNDEDMRKDLGVAHLSCL